MSDLEEQLLTLVMLERSLDAVFVGALEQMEIDGTDALCLSKIPAGSVVVSWLDLESANRHVARLGLPWTLAEQSGPSKIRFRKLDLTVTAAQMMDELRQVLEQSSIKTVQISLGTPTSSKSMQTAVERLRTSTANAQVSIQPKREDVGQRTGRDELDQLVDDLEAMDL